MEDFTSASRRTLKFLHKQFGFGLWMVTRVENDNWVVLSAEDHNYGIQEGEVLKWSDSFCTHMVNGAGPNIALDANQVAAYRQAPIGRQMRIGSYVGIPIRQTDGSLFGTLCAISPEKQSPELEKQLECVRMAADLLSCLLNSELRALNAVRRFERTLDNTRIDYLTSLYNRQGWIGFLNLEEDRCRRYGHPACVISIDLDGLVSVNDRQGRLQGDALLKEAACSITSAVRSSDIVARMKEGEFAVLCVECDRSDATVIMGRIRSALAEKNIGASMGMAMRRPETGLNITADAANRSKSEQKRR